MGLPIIISGDASSAEISWDLRFRKAYAARQPMYKEIASDAPSNTRVTAFPIQARLPKLRKWTGERQVQNAKAYVQQITNEKFELTLGVPVEDFEDDQLGVYNATIDDMGDNAAMWPDDLVFNLLNDGENQNGYDGNPFFYDSHSLGGHTIDNLFASTALTHDNYGAVREAMGSWVDESGTSLRVTVDALAVPPALEQIGRQVLMADFLASTAGTATQSNIWKGTAKLLVIPQLAASAGGSDTAWYPMCTSRAVKPFVMVTRKAPQFAMLTRPEDDTVFNEDQYRYGVRARGAAGFGPFWLCAKAKA
jgi:phage major head subunit gpT-like protein